MTVNNTTPVMPIAGEVVGITRRNGSYVTGYVQRVRNGHVKLVDHATRFIALSDIADVDRCAPGCPDCPAGSPSAARR